MDFVKLDYAAFSGTCIRQWMNIVILCVATLLQVHDTKGKLVEAACRMKARNMIGKMLTVMYHKDKFKYQYVLCEFALVHKVCAIKTSMEK